MGLIFHFKGYPGDAISRLPVNLSQEGGGIHPDIINLFRHRFPVFRDGKLPPGIRRGKSGNCRCIGLHKVVVSRVQTILQDIAFQGTPLSVLVGNQIFDDPFIPLLSLFVQGEVSSRQGFSRFFITTVGIYQHFGELHISPDGEVGNHQNPFIGVGNHIGVQSSLTAGEYPSLSVHGEGQIARKRIKPLRSRVFMEHVAVIILPGNQESLRDPGRAVLSGGEFYGLGTGRGTKGHFCQGKGSPGKDVSGLPVDLDDPGPDGGVFNGDAGNISLHARGSHTGRIAILRQGSVQI